MPAKRSAGLPPKLLEVAPSFTAMTRDSALRCAQTVGPKRAAPPISPMKLRLSIHPPLHFLIADNFYYLLLILPVSTRNSHKDRVVATRPSMLGPMDKNPLPAWKRTGRMPSTRANRDFPHAMTRVPWVQLSGQ